MPRAAGLRRGQYQGRHLGSGEGSGKVRVLPSAQIRGTEAASMPGAPPGEEEGGSGEVLRTWQRTKTRCVSHYQRGYAGQLQPCGCAPSRPQDGYGYRAADTIRIQVPSGSKLCLGGGHTPVELNVLKKEKLIRPSLVRLTSRPLNSSPLPTSPSTRPAEVRDRPLASARVGRSGMEV